nr:hypothetical protein [Tanacetum cinerariifolium]
MASLADKAILSGADNRPPMLEKDMYDSWESRMELYMLNRPHGRMILESVEQANLSGADNRPSMLKKDMYDSWKSRMEIYMLNRQHGRMILESVENGPLLWPTVEENEVTRPKKYSELSAAEAIQADCDVKATNIILQGLPPEVYALVSTHKVAKELWEIIQMLMQGTSLTKQERKCKLYDEFDKFAYKKGESLRNFYLRFSLLLNDMNIHNMKLEQFQVNTKFLNTLHPEWSKFVTDVKLLRDLHTTNVDQLHAYLGQHEYHANETMASDQLSSDPAPECQTMTSDQNSSDPAPEYRIVTTSNELDLLFSPMFDELLNGSSKVVSKSSAVSTADAPNQRQQLTTPLYNHTTPAPTCQIPTLAPTVISFENINQAETHAENDQVADDEFINIFSNPVQDQGETSTRHVNSSNMHTFYQRRPLSLHHREGRK